MTAFFSQLFAPQVLSFEVPIRLPNSFHTPQDRRICTNVAQFKNEEYLSATDITIKESKKLVEAGLEYVTAIDGVKILRKRK